jgi:hypothetical protein
MDVWGGSRRMVGQPEVIQKRASRKLMDDLLEADFWTIFRGGGLADRLLVRITYGMAIYQHLSAPASLRDNFRVADNSAAIGLLSVETWRLTV